MPKSQLFTVFVHVDICNETNDLLINFFDRVAGFFFRSYMSIFGQRGTVRFFVFGLLTACHQVGLHLPGWPGETIFIQDRKLVHSGFP
ncbi:hypothetical protein, partial [Pseudomonas sp. 5Ae-yellow]|uniref:hypothetical protein n=1 Tax=Pseudomonas sp. 5Ae-yellow TaxID=2759848 RepID=UPI001C7135AC